MCFDSWGMLQCWLLRFALCSKVVATRKYTKIHDETSRIRHLRSRIHWQCRCHYLWCWFCPCCMQKLDIQLFIGSLAKLLHIWSIVLGTLVLLMCMSIPGYRVYSFVVFVLFMLFTTVFAVYSFSHIRLELYSPPMSRDCQSAEYLVAVN